eukprot:UN21002
MRTHHRGHIEGLDLVDVVVIHAPLGEDILTPCAELPVATVVCARCEHAVAILQVLGEHLDCRLADDLQVAEEAVLDAGTILVVEAVWRISWLGAQPSPQTLRDENGIGVVLDSVVCRPPLAHLADLHPDLVEHPPIHPGARVLSLQLVELAETILHLDGHVTIRVVDWHRHVAEHVPLLASENTRTLSCNNVQQLELMAYQCLIACIFCVQRETIEVLPERRGNRHRVRADDVTSESLYTSCTRLVALGLPFSLSEALVPRGLATASTYAILSGLRARRIAGHNLDSLLLVLQARQVRTHALCCGPCHTHQRCHSCCPNYQARHPAAATRCNRLGLGDEALVLAVAIHGECGGEL